MTLGGPQTLVFPGYSKRVWRNIEFGPFVHKGFPRVWWQLRFLFAEPLLNNRHQRMTPEACSLWKQGYGLGLSHRLRGQERVGGRILVRASASALWAAHKQLSPWLRQVPCPSGRTDILESPHALFTAAAIPFPSFFLLGGIWSSGSHWIFRVFGGLFEVSQ